VRSCAQISNGFQFRLDDCRSQEGSQFVKGFGGIGGLLRYKVEFADLDMDAELDDIDYEDYL
jgi:peptide chain release factor subunit 1